MSGEVHVLVGFCRQLIPLEEAVIYLCGVVGFSFFIDLIYLFILIIIIITGGAKT